MDMTELNRELERCREALRLRARLLRQREDLLAQRREREDRAGETARSLEKERRDVEKLEGYGPKALWARLSGEHERRLSQEEREVLAAQLCHEQAVRDLEDIRERIEKLDGEIRAVTDCRARYDGLLEEKTALLRESGGPRGARLAVLEEEKAALQAQRKEIGEALSAGMRARSALLSAAAHLDEAEDLGAWDMLGGGLLTTLAKHESLGEARCYADEAQRALSRFRTELADIRITAAPQVEIGGFATFADYFFDGLFADWAVQSQIHDAQYSVSRTEEQVRQVLSRLERMDRDAEARAKQIEEELTRIVEEA